MKSIKLSRSGMWRIGIHSDPKNVERCLTPCLLLIRKSSKDDSIPVVGLAVCLGWWKWGISIMNFNIEDEQDRTIF